MRGRRTHPSSSIDNEYSLHFRTRTISATDTLLIDSDRALCSGVERGWLGTLGVMKQTRVVLYSRVSTAHHDQRPEIQEHELKSYAEARGWLVVESIVDHGYSGATDTRPGLQQLMKLVRERKVDCVCVLKLDRLGRSLRHLLTMLEDFESVGVSFVAVKDAIDMTSAAGRLMASLIGAFASFEREMIRERTLLGLEHARRKGKRLGRPKTRDDDQIQLLRSQGLSYGQIQTRLGVTKSAVYRACKAVAKSPSGKPTLSPPKP